LSVPRKPELAAKYSASQVARIKSTCLYLATKLGDLMPEMVIVGGLVPSLIIDQENLQPAMAAHVGTMDLDLALSFALVGEERYREVAERLRAASFEPDQNENGRLTRHRWRISNPPVTVDFLIEPENVAGIRPGSLFPLTSDWAAIVAPGLHLAFRNSKMVTLRGQTIVGESAERQVRVCGAGAYVVLKALAFHWRGENKDAYDLFYVVRNYGSGVSDVAAELRPLLDDPTAVEALTCLRKDFGDADSVGPRRTAEFIYGRPDADTQADAVGFMQRLLTECSV
jgi:hypothetical protein